MRTGNACVQASGSSGSKKAQGSCGSLRLRFFGLRNLIEDASQRSDPTTLVYLQLGYRFNERWEENFDVFNLLDS